VPITELPPYVIVAESHPLAHLPAVTVAALVDHPMVLLDLPISADYFLSFFDRIGAKPVIAERTRDMAVMRSLVANGFGYSIANMRPLIAQSPDGKPLKFIPIAGAVRRIHMGLLMSSDADRANVVRVFVEYCKALKDTGALPGLEAGK